MVAFSPTNMPANIDTVEKATAWCHAVLHSVVGDATFQVSVTRLEQEVSSYVFPYQSSSETVERLTINTYLPVTSARNAPRSSVIDAVEELSDAAIPAEYLA